AGAGTRGGGEPGGPPRGDATGVPVAHYPHCFGPPPQLQQAALEELIASLNPVQREAVEHLEGPLLIFAGAGSGKTRVLTTRIANLIAHRKVWPDRLLAVEFPNKDAREMREPGRRLVD